MVVLCLVALGGYSPALAQGPPCFPLSIVEQSLWANYGERPVKELLTENNRLLLLFADREGTSWTVVELRSKGAGTEACQQGSGRYWQDIEWRAWEGPET